MTTWSSAFRFHHWFFLMVGPPGLEPGTDRL
jgi:hypothetical protein